MWQVKLLLLTYIGAAVKANPITFPDNYGHSNLTYFVNLLGQLSTTYLEKDAGNVIISPWNIHTCLNILYLGAKGQTKGELARVVGGDSYLENVTSILGSVKDVIASNGVFLDRSATVKPEFVSLADAWFKASIYNVSFKDTQETLDSINKWVSVQTNGTISEMLAEPLDPATSSVIVSTLYFNGQWKYPFMPELTKRQQFKGYEENVEVDLMSTMGTMSVMKSNTYTSVRLPYTHGRLNMHIVLPRGEGPEALSAVLAEMTPEHIETMVTSYRMEQAIVFVPKVKISAKYSLRKMLQARGLNSMFESTQADFSNLIDDKGDVFLSDLYHNVYLEINEKGTLAAAASAGVLTRSRVFTLRADRPFIFFIRQKSGAVLFMGVIREPF